MVITRNIPIDDKKEFDNATKKLLTLSKSDTESTRENAISSWLTTNDIDNVTQTRVKGDPPDIHLEHRYCIIEVKTSKQLKNGPEALKTGAKGNESAFGQLCRYIDTERTHTYHEDKLQWRGFVTDGVEWWAWEWPLVGEGSKPKSIPKWKKRKLTKDNLDELFKLLDRKNIGKKWPKSDYESLFNSIKKHLTTLYEIKKKDKDAKIQKQLWFEQLKGGGNAPTENDADKLFVNHTLLILISRMISGLCYNESKPELKPKLKPKLLEGFVGWCDDTDVLKHLQDIIDEYDWTHKQDDIFRSLYHKFVSKEHRKTYGEYYTPDWLAQKICQDVISEDYINEQVDKYYNGQELNGILDPACGSGTFLKHASNRVKGFDDVKKMTEHDRKKFISKLICGIDIHPVAVEMATANMSIILGNGSTDTINVYQGDSLLLTRSDSTIHSGEKTISLYTPKGNMFTLPREFLKNSKHIEEFVSSALEQSRLSHDLKKELDKDDIKTLEKAYEDMKAIILDEGNGVWTWYIKNQSAPLLMSNSTRMKIIIANPPWVRNSIVKNKSLKDSMIFLAKELEVWEGGNKSTSFDMATLFVIRCMSLYALDNASAGWVLPYGAMNDEGSWEKLREKIKEKYKKLSMYDFGNIPFPQQSPSTVFIIGDKNIHYKVKLKNGVKKLESTELWNNVKKDVAFMKNSHSIKIKTENNGMKQTHEMKYVVRNGATLFPKPLVRIDDVYENDGKNSIIKMEKSNDIKWEKISVKKYNVPNKWIYDCVFSHDIVPYHIPTKTKCVIPIINDAWDKNRMSVKFWNDVSYMYERSPISGPHTPKTLETRLNYNKALFKQFKQSGYRIVYNKSGKTLYASIVDLSLIVENTAYRVSCKTKQEALFLCTILNSECMQEAYKNTKKSLRHFDTHFWKEIPIPRYDSKNKIHVQLTKLSINATITSKKYYNEKDGNVKNRQHLRKKLQECGISNKIDNLVRKILPKYAQ